MTDSEDAISEIHSYGIDIKNREIYLHSYRDAGEEDPGVDHRMASMFTKNLRYLDLISNDPLLIHMQSIGGRWNDGMAIFDAIKACKSPITMLTYSQAESMSSVILQAADRRIMMPNSYFMAHFGSTGMSGNTLDVHNYTAFEKDYIVNIMMKIYAERAHDNGKFFLDKAYSLSKTKAYIRRKMKEGDWYLTAEEAVLYGFADSVYKKNEKLRLRIKKYE